MVSGKTLALAAGGGLVAAEATGVTNITGAGGEGMDFSFDLPVPGEAGGGGLDGLGQAIAGIAAMAQDGVGEATDSIEDVSGGLDLGDALLLDQLGSDGLGSGDGFNLMPDLMPDAPSAPTPGPAPSGDGSVGSPSTTGGSIGRNLGEFVWQSSAGPLAQAIDANVPGFGGNAAENIDNITDFTTDPVGDFARSTIGGVPGAIDRAGLSGGLTGSTDSNVLDAIDAGITRNDSSNVLGAASTSASDALSGGLTGSADSNVADALLGNQASEGPLTSPIMDALDGNGSGFSNPVESSAFMLGGGLTGSSDSNVFGAASSSASDALSGGLTGSSDSNVIDSASSSVPDLDGFDPVPRNPMVPSVPTSGPSINTPSLPDAPEVSAPDLSGGLTGDEDSNALDAAGGILGGAPVL